MAMSDGDREDATRRCIQKMFVEAGATATFSKQTIRDAVNAIDDALDSLVAAHLGTDTIEAALNKSLPVTGENFKVNATTEQKALVLAFVAMKRYGVI